MCIVTEWFLARVTTPTEHIDVLYRKSFIIFPFAGVPFAIALDYFLAKGYPSGNKIGAVFTNFYPIIFMG